MAASGRSTMASASQTSTGRDTFMAASPARHFTSSVGNQQSDLGPTERSASHARPARLHLGGARRSLRFELVPASEVVHGAVEEVAHHVIEVLDGIQLDADHVAPDDAIARELHQTVVPDEAAKVMLDEDQGVDDLAEGYALAEALRTPALVLRSYRVLALVGDPLAQVVVHREDPCLELVPGNETEGRCARVGGEVLQRLLGQRIGVCLYQLDESRGDHDARPRSTLTRQCRSLHGTMVPSIGTAVTKRSASTGSSRGPVTSRSNPPL